jgi:CRP/FNR family cyclic AMP-dependent transcriptional regulator
VIALPEPGYDGASTSASPARTVSLLRVDAELRDAVPPGERRFAERVLIAPRRTLDGGAWASEMLAGDIARPVAALLLRGVVTHEVVLAGRCNAHLLGPGDLFRPWRSVGTSLPASARWTATGGAEVAVLDERFLLATRRWPMLSAQIYERLAEQVELAAHRAAILGLPRVEDRVLALFWQLADRWGVVRPDGVVVRLSLTHALIGHLVGAQRPTVSLALLRLAREGLLRRTDGAGWLLAHDSLTILTGRPEAEPARPASVRAVPPGTPDVELAV